MSGRRHSEQDMRHIRGARGYAKRIMQAMRALGDDGMPSAKAVQIDPAAHPGAMVALMLDADDQQALRDAAGLPDAEADHVTLVYLGADAALLEPHKNDLLLALTQLAQATPPLEGSIGGLARFTASEGSGGQDVLVALYDDPALPGLHAAICACLAGCGIVPPSDHGFTPHITLALLTPDAAAPIGTLDRVPLSFGAISLIWAGERIDLPLLGEMDDPIQEAPMAADSINYDQAAQRVRDAWTQQHDGPGVVVPWPNAVLSDAIVVDVEGHLYHIPYQVTDDAIVFADRALWTEVAQEYIPVDDPTTTAALDKDATLVYAGGPIKALGAGRVGGFGVQFAPGRDLTDEYFTAKTFLGRNDGDGQDTYFHHAIPIKGMDELATRTFSPAKAERRDLGIWVEAVLDMADEYERHVYGLAEKGKLGWSSGAAGHLVRKSRDGEITRWPVVEWSLTPSPAEPRNRVMPLKTLPPVAIDDAPQAVGDTATGATRAAPIIHAIHRGDRSIMDEEQLKALLGDQFKTHLTAVDERLAQSEQRINQGINDRLKAIEDSPALKSAGFVTDGTHLGDKESRKSFADWLLAVKSNNRRRLARYGSEYKDYDGAGEELKALGEESGGTGGYTVPVEYETSVSKISSMMSVIEPLAFPVPMSSAEKKIPKLNQTDNPTANGVGASAFFGGMYFTFDPENAEIDEREPEFEMMTLRARKLAGLTVSSNELREDSSTIETELTEIFGEGLALAKDYAFLKANGVGKPLGMLNAANSARYLLSRAGSGNDIDTADVTAMLARMIPSLYGDAIWLCNPLALKDLLRVQLVSNGDSAFRAAPRTPGDKSPLVGFLLEKPVFASEFLSPLGTAGDLALVAPRAYAVGTRRGLLIAGSEHYRFNRDQFTWRITSRFDGQPRISGTVKLADGSNSEVSAFVVLN